MRAAADAGWRIAQQSSTALSPTSWLAASNADFARFRARYPFPFTSALPPLYATLLHFMALHVYPNESTYSDQVHARMHTRMHNTTALNPSTSSPSLTLSASFAASPPLGSTPPSPSSTRHPGTCPPSSSS